MTHPTDELLALFSSADLPLLDRWRVSRHLDTCGQCGRQLGILRAANVELKRLAGTETLTGFEAIVDWSRLEREMEGNIIVGVAAARCIERGPNRRGLAIKLALALGLMVLFVLGWITHIPSEQSSRIFSALRGSFTGDRPVVAEGPFLRTQADGIVVGSPEGSLTLLHPGNAVVSVSGASSVEARYVDDETGQVTIASVYGQ